MLDLGWPVGWALHVYVNLSKNRFSDLTAHKFGPSLGPESQALEANEYPPPHYQAESCAETAGTILACNQSDRQKRIVGRSMGRNEKRPERGVFSSFLAERGGFEPPIGY